MVVARPKRATVDYFPHVCVHGQTMFIIEQRFGNDGYAFWFKLLEMLGSADGHYLDLNNAGTAEFLVSKTRTSEGFCTGILDLLAKLDAIDAELWASKVVWCQKFVDGVSPAYTKRGTETPSRPGFLVRKPDLCEVSGARNPQTILDETIREEHSCDSAESPAPSDLASLWNETCGTSLPKCQKLTENRKRHAKARLREGGRDLAWWQAYFARIAASAFCRGETGGTGWKASFDWAIRSEDVVAKVFEGKYDDKKPVALAPPAAPPVPTRTKSMQQIMAEAREQVAKEAAR